jgi:hypothetical protein
LRATVRARQPLLKSQLRPKLGSTLVALVDLQEICPNKLVQDDLTPLEQVCRAELAREQAREGSDSAV